MDLGYGSTQPRHLGLKFRDPVGGDEGGQIVMFDDGRAGSFCVGHNPNVVCVDFINHHRQQPPGAGREVSHGRGTLH